MQQQTLFAIHPPPAADTRREGLDHVRQNGGGKLRAMLLGLLAKAGRVSADGKVGGLTIQEAARKLTELRELPTAQGCICGRLGELRRDGLVVDSGYTRIGSAGVRNKVWTLKDLQE